MEGHGGDDGAHHADQQTQAHDDHGDAVDAAPAGLVPLATVGAADLEATLAVRLQDGLFGLLLPRASLAVPTAEQEFGQHIEDAEDDDEEVEAKALRVEGGDGDIKVDAAADEGDEQTEQGAHHGAALFHG